MDISMKCDSLKAIYSVKNGMLRCVTPYEFTISQTNLQATRITHNNDNIVMVLDWY